MWDEQGMGDHFLLPTFYDTFLESLFCHKKIQTIRGNCWCTTILGDLFLLAEELATAFYNGLVNWNLFHSCCQVLLVKATWLLDHQEAWRPLCLNLNQFRMISDLTRRQLPEALTVEDVNQWLRPIKSNAEIYFSVTKTTKTFLGTAHEREKI